MTKAKKGAIVEALDALEYCSSERQLSVYSDTPRHLVAKQAHANLQAFVDKLDLDKLRQEEYSMKYLVDLTQHMYEATKGIEG